jgi:hypothetical protein
MKRCKASLRSIANLGISLCFSPHFRTFALPQKSTGRPCGGGLRRFQVQRLCRRTGASRTLVTACSSRAGPAPSSQALGLAPFTHPENAPTMCADSSIDSLDHLLAEEAMPDPAAKPAVLGLPPGFSPGRRRARSRAHRAHRGVRLACGSLGQEAASQAACGHS